MTFRGQHSEISILVIVISFHGPSRLTNHPELRRTTQPSNVGGLLGNLGFCVFHSTAYHFHVMIRNVNTYYVCPIFNIILHQKELNWKSNVPLTPWFLDFLEPSHLTLQIVINMFTYRQIYNITCTLLGKRIVDHSDVVGVSPVGAAPTTSSFSI